MATRLDAIVAALGGELAGGENLTITRLAPLETAGPTELAFVAHPRYASLMANSAAGALIVSPALAEQAARRGASIVTDNPYLYFARLTQWWRAREPQPAAPAVHPSAWIDPSAQVAEGVSIGPFAVVEAGARIGAGTRLGAHVTVGRDCTVGERCILHPGVVIGADGFGFASDNGTWVKIEQLGAVRIGNDVEIGANSCVDRGALDDTVIEDGVKLDNLVQIGHNVHVGAHTAMAGCAGVAGSARIGRRCTVGGGAVVLGHLALADDVHISAASVVTRSIHQPGHYSGVFPLDDNASWEKNAATLKQLHRLRERLKTLEQNSKP